jgi:hypothetical protein
MNWNSKILTAIILIGGLVLSYIFFPKLIFSVPLLIILVSYFLWIKSKLIWLIFLFQPFITFPAISIANTIKDYFKGDATLINNRGQPINDLVFIDSVYRVPILKTDIITSYDPYINCPRNITTKSLVKTFGYQPGSYIEEWPNRNIVLHFLKKNYSIISFNKGVNGINFIYNKVRIDLSFCPFFNSKESVLYISKFNDSDSCILFSFEIPENSKSIYVYDVKNSRILAVYNYV